MDVDLQACSRARLARDPRFDGKFYIGVLTTRIYCRPICRARTSNESNVRYFPTAAAAAEAGFRPCLRCRPESSPGTAASLGTRNTVSRALRLIEESALEEDDSVETLAKRLGIGARHLRRLFLQHLGATPGAVMQTRRLHFAKKLIDETKLPMTQLAMASGFGSVRRFNAAIRKNYRRTPTQIRKLAKTPDLIRENHYVLRLSYRPPYNWKTLLSYLASRAIPGVELVEDNKYSRTISLNGATGYIEVTFRPENNELSLQVQFGDSRALFTIVERVREMFDLKADWSVIAATLGRDPILRKLIHQKPGLRVPGCWDGFELTTRAILDQHMSPPAATTMTGHIAKAFGRAVPFGKKLNRLFPAPQDLADADFTGIGLPKSRVASIRALARGICKGEITFERCDRELFLRKILDIPGVGNWTASYVAMRALREPDAFPSEDLWLLRALKLQKAAELEDRSKAWRPWRSYAAMHLWNIAARPAEQTNGAERFLRRGWDEKHRDDSSPSAVT